MIYLFTVWIVGSILSWIMMAIHDVLVSKHQPKQKSRAYQKEMVQVGLLSIVPLVNFAVALYVLINIIRYTPEEDSEDGEM